MGDTIVVECAGEEAIGMALACDLPISVDQKVWQEVTTDIALGNVEPLAVGDPESVFNVIPPVKSIASDRAIVTEGGEVLLQGRANSKESSQGNSDRSMADEVLEETDITIDSLEDYESLSIPDRARYVLSSGRFDGKLPRPRVLREFQEQVLEFVNLNQQSTETKNKDEQRAPIIRTTLSPLDEILVPIIENELVQLEIKQKDAILRRDQMTADAIKEKIQKIQKIEQ